MAIIIGSRKKLIASLLKGFSIHYSGGGSAQAAITSRTYSQKVGDGLDCDVIMIPVLWAARRMAESPIGVQKVGDNAIDMQHPLARLLKRPCPWYSGSAFRKAQTIEWLLDGNAYSYKIRGRHKEVLAEQFIPHWAIFPHAPDVGFIDYYEYYPAGVTSRTGGMQKLLPEDVVHLRNGVDPNNPVLGLSPLKILLRELYTDVEASEFTAMLLRNAGVMGVVISPKEGGTMMLPGEKPEDAKKRYQQQWAGTRRGEPFIGAGPLDVNYVGVDAAKLDLSRLRDIPEERVTGLLGIPAAVAGLGTGLQQTKVGATMSEMRAMAYEDCIIPMQHEWSGDWDLQLLPEFETNPENFCTAWDLSKVRVLQDDENKKSERLTRQFSAGGITRLQYNQELGYETKPDDDVYYISIATQIVPKAQAGASYVPPEPTTQPAPKALPAPALKATRAPANISRLMHRLDAERKRQITKWTGILERKFKAYGDHAAATFERVAKEHGLKASEPEYVRAAEIALEDIDALDLAYGPEYLAIAKDTCNSINMVLNLGVNLSAPAEQRILSRGGIRKGLVDIEQQTKDAIFAAIEKGRANGEGAAGIVDLIREMVAAGPWGSAATRAMVIARTEAKYAQNISSLEAYKDSDTVTGVEVFDAQLGPTDEECEIRNGRIVTFRVGELMVNNEHPQGTISLAPYVGELPDDADEEQRLITFGSEMPETKAASNGNGHSPVFNLTVGGDGKIHQMKRNIKITRDALGRMTGAEVVEVPVSAEKG